jgi:hypothetical protein
VKGPISSAIEALCELFATLLDRMSDGLVVCMMTSLQDPTPSVKERTLFAIEAFF